jgi:hypothetical protein
MVQVDIAAATAMVGENSVQQPQGSNVFAPLPLFGEWRVFQNDLSISRGAAQFKTDRSHGHHFDRVALWRERFTGRANAPLLISRLGLFSADSGLHAKLWQGGMMILRWTAAGVLEAERHFRKVAGYRALPKLAAALPAHDIALDRATTKVDGPKMAA